MQITVKAQNYLANSRHEFHPSQIATAKLIWREINRQNWKDLGQTLQAIDPDEKEQIHYAFFDLYGYDYELKIRSMLSSSSDLKKYGLM
jgi:hypothetical protein